MCRVQRARTWRWAVWWVCNGYAGRAGGLETVSKSGWELNTTGHAGETGRRGCGDTGCSGDGQPCDKLQGVVQHGQVSVEPVPGPTGSMSREQ
eukprot:1244369-Rhodomonas_salina.1